jgi:hypothetical protein
MCDKCDELDKKAERYRAIASRTTDQALLDGIRDLLQQVQDQKGARHPKEEQATSAGSHLHANSSAPAWVNRISSTLMQL